MRELTLEELELISGGTWTDQEIVVVADGDGGDDWGDGGGDWGDWGDYGDYGDYGDQGGGGDSGQASGPGAIDLTGDTCPVAQGAATDSLNSLYQNSPTARALIDAMAARGTDLNLIQANLAGGGPQARFDSFSNQILWDPFVYVVGVNTDQSQYVLAPIMVLAHELVHAGHADDPAYQGAGSEALVMQVANQIAAEMNAATGSSYNTTRDSHIHQDRYWTNSPTSTTFSISRPGCS
jgi:hypothetical protein